MKLLFFIYSLRTGGAERVTSNLANHWSALGWEVSIVTMLPQSFDFYQLHSGVRRICIGLATDGGNAALGLLNNTRRIWRLRRTLQEVQPDVAIGMMTSASVLLALAASGVPRVVTIGSERTYPPAVISGRSLWGRLRRWTYGKLTAVTAQTDGAKSWLQSNTLASRVTVIPNPVEWPLAIHDPTVAPHDIVPEGMHVLLAAGRLELEKGFDWLVDVFATLSKKHSNWVLVILGEGTQRKALEEKIAKGDVRGKTFLPGLVGNVADWYSRADIFVLSSRFEGFPNTLLEALAYGLPVVSTDCESGPRDIICNGINGLLVAAGDLLELTSALDRLMSSESMRRRLAEAATDARERFSKQRVATMWEALFKEATHVRK